MDEQPNEQQDEGIRDVASAWGVAAAVILVVVALA